MKIIVWIFVFILVSCSHEQGKNTVSITSGTKGVVKYPNMENSIYLTSDAADKDAPEKSIKIHQGHFLSSKNTKAQNENVLSLLEANNFHIINLTLEDIAIAEKQEIKFENYKKLIFLNSSISDLSKDDLYSRENVLPYYVFTNVVFIGLSDKVADKSIDTNRFLINDYVFSVLKVRKATREQNFKSYILIHNLGKGINDIMDRLPPTFINSLAN